MTPRILRLLGIAGLMATATCTQHTADQEVDTARVAASDTTALFSDTYETLFRDPEDRTRFLMRQLRRLVSEYHDANGELPVLLGDVLDPSLEARYRQMALS